MIGYLLGLEYLERLPDIAKDGEREFVPYESMALLGALGSVQAIGANTSEAARTLGFAGAASQHAVLVSPDVLRR